jgi:hypothetical protein
VSGQNAHERGACRFEGAGTERDLSIWKMGKRKRRCPIPAKKLCGKILAGIELLAGMGLAQVFAHFRKRMLRLGAKLQKAKVSGQA